MLPLALRLRLRQPPAFEIFRRDPRQVWLYIENRCSIQHIDAANMQCAAVTFQQSYDCQANRIGPARRASSEDSVGTIVCRRFAQKRDFFRLMKRPDNKEV